ncbi:MAG: sugar phosphate isomerase/epimerase [Candidatus Marinimicrobia bacterium]|jgi:sugar phosphate isomerase/epimerase|nr:sugar phosphate isomerase/epimerase [Candidatus Neomarinimicrobiota bacterium]
MAELGLITDGISTDFEHALKVMSENGLNQAELQYLWDKEVGDFDKNEIDKIEELLKRYKMEVSCISRHNFAGIGVHEVNIGDSTYNHHMEKLKECINMAQKLGSPLVRIMSFRKEMVLFGEHGAEKWNVSDGAWSKLVELLSPVVQLAKEEGIMLVVETGNNAMITSCFLGKKLIDDLETTHLKVLWDPANALYCGENPSKNALDSMVGGYLGHVHMKDVEVSIHQATIKCVALGEGQMAPHLSIIAERLNDIDYKGSMSLESVYRPSGGDFEDGFQASISTFINLFS